MSERDKIQFHRAGQLELAERKCLPRPSWLLSANEISRADRPRIARRERAKHIRMMFRGYHCPSSWLKAVEWAQGPFPGTRDWLLSCSKTGSEGGWGRWFWNGGYVIDRFPTNKAGHGRPSGSSGAGGWMQFLHGTFAANVPIAIAQVRSRGFRIPKLKFAIDDWRSPLGQAITGASMFLRGQRGQWAGSGC